jgi:hypothetical protein
VSVVRAGVGTSSKSRVDAGLVRMGWGRVQGWRTGTHIAAG